jgi:hypothetical protein
MFHDIDGVAVIVGLVIAGFSGVAVNHLVVALKARRSRRCFKRAIELSDPIIYELERQFS